MDNEHIRIGQRWRERDGRFNRIVTVAGFCQETGKVVIEYAGKKTKARADRFNGKSGGYELLSLSPSTKEPAE